MFRIKTRRKREVDLTNNSSRMEDRYQEFLHQKRELQSKSQTSGKNLPDF